SVFTGGIQTIVGRRLSKLRIELQAMTQLAAVMGREVDLSLLAHHYDDAMLNEWLNASAEAMILEIRDNRWR
ncbi:MAG TPA: hypothetical protein PLZ51_16755, partial [Aggregatilineales bacterium]|nr:hypothetical protein [Aggregatilineales bacterium]